MIQTRDMMDANSRTGEASLIRTPDQRVRVFVSSTLDELAPERAAAREAIAQLRLTPVLFESGARPYPPRELYQAYLAQSDIFLCLYWQRSGWVAPGMEVSGVEDEYHSRGYYQSALLYRGRNAKNRNIPSRLYPCLRRSYAS